MKLIKSDSGPLNRGHGWPLDEEVDSSVYNSSERWPKITIVTPSFNQGKFIEETIRSVLFQNYPNLEYIIMDGGSNDETLEVIKKYDDKIHFWVSEKDKGQSDAINKGFAKATGEIVAWLNSDDYYRPFSLFHAAKGLRSHDIGLLYGNASYYYEVDKKKMFINVLEQKKRFHLPFDLGLIQPATFWTKKLWEKVGILDVELHYGFDWEWFLRASKEVKFIPYNFDFAVYRLHENHKTGSGGDTRVKELLDILEKHHFSKYIPAIRKIGVRKNLANRIVSATSKYRLGKLIYGSLRLQDKEFRKFSVLELSEIFKKAVGIYNF